ncbi:MAG: chlorophyll synthase ChlG [Pseudomonadota bacterium]
MSNVAYKGPAKSGFPTPASARSGPASVLELLKPITWFAPMWAFACGAVSSGVPLGQNLLIVLGGMILAGPLVCGMSQAINDWHDRHVDAINEPDRPIPSGRIPGQWGLYIAVIWTGISLLFSSMFGVWVFGATVFGLVLAWAYSAPPLRLKTNGWWGNAAVGLCYEGLAWFTGAAVLLHALPDGRIILLALLYSLGAHGIMTLNDFKSVEGDRRMNVRSLPVQLGVGTAARLACLVMAVPQVIVIGLLLWLGKPGYALAVGALLAAQGWLMARYLLDMATLLMRPRQNAALYNASGTTLYVIGMLVAAFAVRGLVGA